MITEKKEIIYDSVNCPRYDFVPRKIDLTDETMLKRHQNLLIMMKRECLDAVAIYADREHGDNFEYLCGFSPRFEEALLIVRVDGHAGMLLGNEMLRMADYSRIKVKAVHAPCFSLPNQPLHTDRTMEDLLAEGGVENGTRIAVVGWKMFTSQRTDGQVFFDVPHYIVESIKRITGMNGCVINGTGLFINPETGIRTTVNANEIAHFEFGASLASHGILDLMNQIEPGRAELMLANHLNTYGQQITVQTICAAGARFTNGVVESRDKMFQLGETFSSTLGLSGGLTNRTGYVAYDEADLKQEVRDYLDKVVKPYYAAVVTWYQNIGVGVRAEYIFDLIEKVIPQKQYGWTLNPGHLTSTEEWMSSPFYKGSEVVLRSGMMIQMDIIVNVKGYGGSNAEDGIVIADERLRRDLAAEYPQVWERISQRRTFMKDVLGIKISDDVLPMSDSNGYLRPFVLNHEKAMKVTR